MSQVWSHMPLNLAQGKRLVDLCEFKAILVYKAGPRTTSAVTQKSPIFKNPKSSKYKIYNVKNNASHHRIFLIHRRKKNYTPKNEGITGTMNALEKTPSNLYSPERIKMCNFHLETRLVWC